MSLGAGFNNGGMAPALLARCSEKESKMTIYGYARVSTTEQNTAAQMAAFERAGIVEVIQEKRSASIKRPALEQLLRDLQSGDVLVVYKIDRLARSLSQLLKLLDDLEARGVQFRSLTEPIDTTTPAGRMFAQMLGAFAEFERAVIRERCAAGFAEAKARGQKFGRERSLDKEQEAELVRQYLTGAYTMKGLAHNYGIHLSSVKRAIYRVTKPGHSSLK
jgi:DNA invertase Pin-like site-specific DNA recombinase